MTRGPARGVVRAKTGTTNLASALAGYAGSGYVFAILMNGNPSRTGRRASPRIASRRSSRERCPSPKEPQAGFAARPTPQDSRRLVSTTAARSRPAVERSSATKRPKAAIKSRRAPRRARPSSALAPTSRSKALLVEELDAEPLRLLELRAGVLAHDEAARLLRHRVGHLGAELLERGLRLLARPARERPGDDVGLAGQRPFARAARPRRARG